MTYSFKSFLELRYYNFSRSNAAANNPYGCLSTPKHTLTHTHRYTLGVKPQRGRGHLMVLVFCTLDSTCGLFLPLRGALSVVEELKWIFSGSVCWLTVTSWPWFTRSPRPRPAIISITRWFLRRVPCACWINNAISVKQLLLPSCSHLLSLSLVFLSLSVLQTEKSAHGTSSLSSLVRTLYWLTTVPWWLPLSETTISLIPRVTLTWAGI